MTISVKAHQTVPDPGTLLERFIALNQARLKRTRDALRPRQQDLFDLLPLLFHINQPGLPGYVARDTPAGLPNYEPSRQARHAATRIIRGFRLPRQVQRNFPIRAIFLMGSPGSVAYAEDSDFDVWLCHDPGLSDDEVTQLRQKADAVNEWAASLDLEVHFFLINPEQFSRGEVDRLSAESSGSAQHLLLLEEFYRTALHLAGCYPLWWLVPPDREADYEEEVAAIHQSRFTHVRHLIDLGGLAHIPAEEFLGAAVWQLYKGIDSPYKSVLKLLLIEAYARQYPHTELLSLAFKRAVYDGETDVDRLDPYLMMMDRVESLLQGQEEQERLQLARRCFYFKVDENLSTDRADLAPWRRDLLMERVARWEWQRHDLMILDSRSEWKVHRVSKERALLFEALSTSYRFLSQFARRYSDGLSRISRQDMNLLGRKLYAAFERKAGKVELLNRGINANLAEEHLTFHELIDASDKRSWVLYTGIVKADEIDLHRPVKRSRYVSELLAWCYFNGVLNRNTTVGVHAQRSSLTGHDLMAVAGRMFRLFPAPAVQHGSVEDFRETARILQGALFANADYDPVIRGEVNGRLASGSSDVLTYGASSDNLVQMIDMVLVTTWQEVLTFHYHGDRGIPECICDYLKWAPADRPPAAITATSFGTAKGDTVARRLEKLFGDVGTALCGADQGQQRYVLRIAYSYYVLFFEEGAPTYKLLPGKQALLGFLGAPQSGFRPVTFDDNVALDPILPLIYSDNRPGIIQLYYAPNGARATIYVLDEHGSLFVQQAPFHDGDALVLHYSRFLDCVINRMNFLLQEECPGAGAEGVEFKSIVRDLSGRLELQPKWPRVRAGQDRYYPLQVIMDLDTDGRTVITAYGDGREFSSLERGTRVFEDIVEHVLHKRHGHAPYPLYITDISMSPALLGKSANHLQTVHFLNYKRRIEDKLNDALMKRRRQLRS